MKEELLKKAERFTNSYFIAKALLDDYAETVSKTTGELKEEIVKRIIAKAQQLKDETIEQDQKPS
jgi:hypothetical protein